MALNYGSLVGNGMEIPYSQGTYDASSLNFSPVSVGASNPVGSVLQTTAPSGSGSSGSSSESLMDSLGLGANIGTMKLAIGGIQTLGNIWAAMQAQKLAKEQFKYQKSVTDTNLANTIQSYNTALGDRANNRAFATGGTRAEADAYVEANKMRRL